MKRFYLLIGICFLLQSSASVSTAQKLTVSDYNSWSAGIKFGLLPFYGDVRQLHYSTENKYKKSNTGFSVEVIKNFNHIFGVKANVLFGGLSGSSPNMNLHFLSNIKEYTVSGLVNLNNLISMYPRREKVLNAYIFAGAGLVDFRSKVYSFDEDAYIGGYGWDSSGVSKTNGTTEMVFPVGIGIKFKADSKIDIGLEITLHLTNTDKLDAWRVDNSYDDRYGYAAISITYKIGSKEEYVDWINPFQDTTLAEILLVQNITPDTNNSTNNQNTNNNNNTSTNNQNTGNNNTTTTINTVVELKYFIVSSTFSSKKLAKESAERLLNKGYPEANIFFQKSSGNWRVAYKGYPTIDDALKDWVTIKKTNSSAKLMEKKGKESYSDITSAYKNYTAPVTKDTTTNVNNNVANNQNTNTTTTNTTNTNTTNTTNINTTNNTNTSNTTNTITTDTNTTNTANTNQNTSTNTNSNTNTSNTTTTNTTTTNTTTTVVKKFYIISGSFATEQLANDGVAALKAKGFADAEVVGKNDYGSYRIAYKGYATREEATADLTGIKQNTNPSAWIFEKK
ncbi:MAG: SPOR domain-containing protein [Bacteroidota bacterium]